MTRSLPRKFKFPFGSGKITEEAGITCQHWGPAVQYLEFTEGKAKGEKAVRFCVYQRGKFSRMPLLLDEEDAKRLGKELQKTDKLKRFLKHITSS